MSDNDEIGPLDFRRVRDDIEERMRRLERLGLGPKAEDFIDHGPIIKPVFITITKQARKGGDDLPPDPRP